MRKNRDVEELKKQISESKIISFDVFDTLLFRKISIPEEIFDLMEKILNTENFAQIRVKLQQECSEILNKKYGYAHANHDEIYEYIKKNHPNLNTEKIKKLEFELEKLFLLPNKLMLSIFEYAKSLNKKIIIISDMYLIDTQIDELLKLSGYEGYSKLYISANYRLAKYDGKLYDKVIKDENIKASDILHIGDNYQADIMNAQNYGIKTWHYKKEKIKELYDNEMFKNNIVKSIHMATLNISLNDPDNKNDFWYNLGFNVIGVLYFGLIQWMKKEMKERGFNKIYLLSRDGYILDKIIKEFSIIDSEYLLTSRRALIIPSIKKLEKDEIDSLPPYVFGQTIKEVLEYIDLNNIHDDSIKKVGFKSKNERIITTEDFENFKKIYKENENEVLNITKKERESAGKYLKSIGINKNDKYIFFDAGWNGSSQKYLENLFKSLDLNIDVEFLYLGIMRTEKSFRQLKNKIYKTFLFDSNNENDIAKTFKKSIIIAELFFSAPHNTVWRYWQKDNNFDVQYGSFDEKVWLQENMIKGAMDYIKFVNPIYEKISLDISPEDASAPLVRLIDSPNYEEAETIGDLYNLDSFAVEKGKKKYIAKTKLLTVIKNNSKDEIYWPQGVLYRRDSDFFTKLIVKNRYNLKRTSNFEVKSYRIIKKFDRYNYLLNRSKNVLKNEGMKSLTKKVYTKLSNRYIKGYNSKSDYDIWIEKKEKNISTKNVELKYNPLISVVIPVYNIKKEYLEECIDSVINQSYSNWELCVADDASTLPEVKKTLRKYEGRENIKIAYRETNGHIAKATNSALELATGDFVAFLDCDDKISKNALFEVANCINENPNIDFIYSDEDKLSENGKNRHSPYFKPDWSPDTFMSIMYTCHLGVYRRKIVNELGGIRGEFNGAQDYDMVLRFTEITNNIYHIPKILYHWREIKGSISASENAKPYAMEAMKKLKEEALKRRNLKGNIELVDDMAQYRVVYLPTNNPMVSIIIPTKNNPDTFLQCIDSINNITLYKNYEVILIDNGSTIENQNKYRELSDKYSCKYFFYDIPFNYSKINNFAVIKSSGDYLLFLNDDTEAIEDSWLERMLGHAMLTHVGAVGAKLYYPNSSTIQHIGITNLSIGPSHTLMSFDDSVVYYFGRNRLDCNCLAVTGACLMVKKQKFISVGKFDESLSIAYNDVDLCFRLHKNGYYNVIRNDVKLYHHESLSRGNDDVDLEKQRRLNNEKTILYKKHKDLMGKDVFYNINLTGRRVDFKIDLDDKLKKDNNLDIDFFEVGDDQIKASIDSIDISNNYLYIKGWAFRCDKSLDSFKIVILLKNKNEILNFDTEIEYRPDVSESFNKLNFKNLDKSGFSLNVFLGDNKFDDSYRIGIMVSTQIERKVLWLEKYVDIKK